MLNVFQIKMAFNSWNYQTMKHSWKELIIIISCCFLRIHSWLKGLSLLFQNKVMRWLFVFFSPILLYKWEYFVFDASFWLMPYNLASPLKSDFLPFIACFCETEDWADDWGDYCLSMCGGSVQTLLIFSIGILHRMFSAYSWLFF